MPPRTASKFGLTGDEQELASFTQLAGISTQAGSVDYLKL